MEVHDVYRVHIATFTLSQAHSTTMGKLPGDGAIQAPSGVIEAAMVAVVLLLATLPFLDC